MTHKGMSPVIEACMMRFVTTMATLESIRTREGCSTEIGMPTKYFLCLNKMMWTKWRTK